MEKKNYKEYADKSVQLMKEFAAELAKEMKARGIDGLSLDNSDYKHDTIYGYQYLGDGISELYVKAIVRWGDNFEVLFSFHNDVWSNETIIENYLKDSKGETDDYDSNWDMLFNGSATIATFTAAGIAECVNQYLDDESKHFTIPQDQE